MKFATRSKEAVLVDLGDKLRTLPASHPDHAILKRMIRDLRSEIAAKPARTGDLPGKIDGRCIRPRRH